METQLDNVEKICMNLFNSIAKDTTDVRKITFLLKHSFFIRKCSSAFVSHNPWRLQCAQLPSCIQLFVANLVIVIIVIVIGIICYICVAHKHKAARFEHCTKQGMTATASIIW